eukprot:10203781-Karenia_brevis.AAC.1
MPPPPQPPSSSNSGPPAATAPSTNADPWQQQDPWQQGAAKKRPFGGPHNGPGTPSVTHEELSIGLSNLGSKLSAGFQKAMADVNVMVSGNIQEGMQELKAYTDARVAATEVKVQSLQATTDEHSKQLAAIQAQVAAMQATQSATANS